MGLPGLIDLSDDAATVAPRLGTTLDAHLPWALILRVLGRGELHRQHPIRSGCAGQVGG